MADLPKDLKLTMADSMYLIVRDVAEFNQRMKIVDPSFDARILTGERQTEHITVGPFARTADGKYIFEVPRTLKELQDKIKLSIYTVDLKSRVDIKNFTPKEITHVMG